MYTCVCVLMTVHIRVHVWASQVTMYGAGLRHTCMYGSVPVHQCARKPVHVSINTRVRMCVCLCPCSCLVCIHVCVGVTVRAHVTLCVHTYEFLMPSLGCAKLR